MSGYNVKIISGYSESVFLDSKGKWRRTGKRISIGQPCDCDACLKAEQENR